MYLFHTTVLLLAIANRISALQTYMVITRVKTQRIDPASCLPEYSDSSSDKFTNFNRDICDSLSQSISSSPSAVSISGCRVESVVCQDNLPLVSTRIDIAGSELTANELHHSFNLHTLIKETVITIDYLQVKDFNECKSGTHNCDISAACRNTAGSYTCTCKQGYTDTSIDHYLDAGRVCNINCGDTSCANNGVCLLVEDQHVCKCLDNYEGPSCELMKGGEEWIWIFSITLAVATFVFLSLGVLAVVFIRNRRARRKKLEQMLLYN